jgi:hypothetical protein
MRLTILDLKIKSMSQPESYCLEDVKAQGKPRLLGKSLLLHKFAIRMSNLTLFFLKMEPNMSEQIVNPLPKPSRLVTALIQVAYGVAEDVIQRAQMTCTPVILADNEGHILTLDAEDLAQQLKNSPL